MSEQTMVIGGKDAPLRRAENYPKKDKDGNTILSNKPSGERWVKNENERNYLKRVKTKISPENSKFQPNDTTGRLVIHFQNMPRAGSQKGSRDFKTTLAFNNFPESDMSSKLKYFYDVAKANHTGKPTGGYFNGKRFSYNEEGGIQWVG